MVNEYIALLLAVHGAELGAERAVGELLRLQAVGSLARSLDAPEVTLDEVRAELGGPGHAFVMVISGWVGGYALVVGQESIDVVELPPQHELVVLREDLLRTVDGFLFGHPRFDGGGVVDLRRAATASFLPDELRAAIDGYSALTIVPIAAMGFIPYELLAWNGESTVGERFAVAHLPSFPVGVALAGRRSRAELPDARELKAAFVVALPGEPGEGGLAFTNVERELLLREWPFATPCVTVGDAATLTAVGPDALRGRSLLQLVAHGERDPESARPYGLKLHGGALTPARAEQLAVPDLVAVLACQALRGPLRRGDDGRDQLAGALFLAGANVQILSHTRIEYRGGLELMNRTYPGLAAGLSTAEALRRARVALRSSATSPGPRWNAALVHAVGLGHRPVVDAPPTEGR
jgi:hypothetical protein